MKWVLITYDVCTINNEGKRRLRAIARLCESYGLRVQNSVFELQISNKDLLVLRDMLVNAMNQKEDSIRIYILGTTPQVEHFGIKESTDLQQPLII